MTTTTSTVTSTTGTQAAQAEAARQAAEARAAAEAARKAAEAAQQAAAQARAAQHAAMEARQQAQTTQNKLDQGGLKPAERQTLQGRLETQTNVWKTAHEKSVTQSEKAQSLLLRAENAQKTLKTSAQEANQAATDAGKPAPFSRDAFSAVEAKNAKTLDKVMGKAPQGSTQSRLDQLQAAVAVRKIAGSKPPSTWLQADAAGFMGRLADQMEKVSPAVQERLLGLTAPGMKRAAEMLGDAGNGDGDESAVKSLAANFSRVGNALPDAQAEMLAYGVAEQIDDDSEQHFMDDGFQEYIDGGGSSKFRDLVAGALDAQDKGDATEELTQSGGGGFSIGGAFDDVTGFVGDVASAAPGAVWDGLSNSVETVTQDPLNAAAGLALGPVGIANLASGGAIVDAGVDVAQKGLVELSEAAFSPLTDAVNTETDKLEPDQSYSIDVSASGGVEVLTASADAQLSVNRNADGSFCVSAGADVSAKILGKLDLPGLSAGVGGRAEFSFENAEDAKRAADTFVRLAASATVPLAGPLAESAATLASGDAAFLADHVSAINLKGDVAASIALKLGGQTGLTGLNLSAQAQASLGVRVELEDGAPKAVVLGEQVHGEVAASGGLAVGPLALAGGEATAGVTVTAQQRFELDEPFTIDQLADPAELISGAKVDGSVSFGFDGRAGAGDGLDVGIAGVSSTQGTGRMASVTVSGDPVAIISEVAPSILRGDFEGAGEAYGDAVGIRAESRSYDYQAGQAGFDLELVSASLSTQHLQLNRNHVSSWGRPPPSIEERINEYSFENFLETVPEPG